MNPKYTETQLIDFAKTNQIPPDVSAKDLAQAKDTDGDSALFYAALNECLPQGTTMDLLTQDNNRSLIAMLVINEVKYRNNPAVQEIKLKTALEKITPENANMIKQFIANAGNCGDFLTRTPNTLCGLQQRLAIEWATTKLSAICRASA